MPDIAVGTVTATPIMRWYGEREGALDRFDQTMLLRVPAGMQEEHLGAALQTVLDHHDALRLQMTAARCRDVVAGDCGARRGGGLEVPAARGCGGPCGCGACGLHRAVGREAEARLSPSRGEIVQAVWFDAGPASSGRLLLTIHHFAVDGVSWRILDSGPEGRVGSGFGGGACAAWSARDVVPAVVAAACRGGACAGPDGRSRVLARDAGRTVAAASGCGRRRWRRTDGVAALTLTLPVATTSALLTRVAAAFHGGINDVLLTALTVALVRARRGPGKEGP